jgi:hypothetical protein
MVIGCRAQLDHSFLLNLSNQIIALLGITLEISDLRTFLSYLLVFLWFDDTVWMTYLAALLDSWFRIHIIDLIWLSIRIQTLHILRRGSVNCMQGFTASKIICLHFLHWIILFLDIDVVRFVWICVQFMNVIVHLWKRTWIVLIFYLRTHDFFDVFCVRLFCNSNIFFFAYILLIFLIIGWHLKRRTWWIECLLALGSHSLNLCCRVLGGLLQEHSMRRLVIWILILAIDIGWW